MCTVSHGVFVLPLGIIRRLCSVAVDLPGHLVNYFSNGREENILKIITQTRLFKYIENTRKGNFDRKNSDNFHIAAQNIDCGTR